MPNQAFPSVNGHECSWADISVDLNIPGAQAIAIVDLESIKHSGKVDVGESRGTSGGRPMKRTAGSATYEASASLTRSGLVTLITAIADAAKQAGAVRGNEVIISAVSFDVLIQHTPLGDTNIYVTKLGGCRLLEDTEDLKQGNDADVIEVTLNPLTRSRKLPNGDWAVLR